MSKQTIVKLTDDLDGTDADRTVTFGLDGTTYEIDLSEKNEAELRDFLQRYVAAGTRVRTGHHQGSLLRPARTGLSPSTATRENKEINTAIREWAQQNGHQLSDRGRIPMAVVQAYNDRHNIQAALNRSAREQAAPEPTPGAPKVTFSAPTKKATAPVKKAARGKVA